MRSDYGKKVEVALDVYSHHLAVALLSKHWKDFLAALGSGLQTFLEHGSIFRKL